MIDVSTPPDSAPEFPGWFDRFLADRGVRKLSATTMRAYQQDFVAIATLLAGDVPLGELPASAITVEAVRPAFATYAQGHAAASIRRCWSTWNTLCGYLFADNEIPANPMPLIGRPRLAPTLPKALPTPSVGALLAAAGGQGASSRKPRATDWPERDTALIATALLAGLRADELRRANIGDIETGAGGAVLRVTGKGNKDRAIPIEAALMAVIEGYLESRDARFPGAAGRTRAAGLAGWPAAAALFVGRDGERITRGTVQSRVKRAFALAGPDARPSPGALVHSLRHTYATQLATAGVDVYTLMRLLGHQSLQTSQRYVVAAGTETRQAAASNPLYGLFD